MPLVPHRVNNCESVPWLLECCQRQFMVSALGTGYGGWMDRPRMSCCGPQRKIAQLPLSTRESHSRCPIEQVQPRQCGHSSQRRVLAASAAQPPPSRRPFLPHLEQRIRGANSLRVTGPADQAPEPRADLATRAAVTDGARAIEGHGAGFCPASLARPCRNRRCDHRTRRGSTCNSRALR